MIRLKSVAAEDNLAVCHWGEQEKAIRHKTLEERATEYNGKLMLDGEYDWGEPVGREV